ncbi:hypothetical protein E6O75_ATG03049 [Venturia nashicola]|uniref:Uncharacterized protein n=1 Tax=Venturia nashicola TaxID=86259 RepID=A0A4Z1P3M1_9PEZI|nr:hypothetical protein E6O75_ATG03049 [Venturia nashicola]
MWSSCLILALLCGQLFAAALTGGSGHNLPRIRPRFPQSRGHLGKGKGFPGGGFGVPTEALTNPPKGPGADPKAALNKAPKDLANPSTATPTQVTETKPLGDSLMALDSPPSLPNGTPGQTPDPPPDPANPAGDP